MRTPTASMSSKDPSLRRQLTSILLKLRSRCTYATLRSLPSFFGLNPQNMCLGATSYQLPFGEGKVEKKEKELTLKQRLTLNVSYFLTNYILLLAVSEDV